MKQMNPNRRTATGTLNTTFDSIHGTPSNSSAHDILLGRDLVSNSLPGGPLTPSADRDNNPFNQRRHKKYDTMHTFSLSIAILKRIHICYVESQHHSQCHQIIHHPPYYRLLICLAHRIHHQYFRPWTHHRLC